MIDDYHLEKMIGSGQYGKVYMATNTKTKEVVAIKCISMSKFSQVPKLEELTRNEINILSSLKNPNIIQFKEMLRTTNNMYMVYEYCNGGNLEEYLHKSRRLSEEETWKIIKQVINACFSLNKNGILHRDLKLQNILLHNSKIKVADFGFCKLLKKLTTKTIVGSPIYMAPEILSGKPYNSKADIWSIGIIFYELLYGYCPFEERTMQRLLAKIIRE